jgi:hypothetical protein
LEKGWEMFEPDIVEVLAALRPAYLRRELGFYRVALEGDALQVVQTLRKDRRSCSHYGHLIEEV